VSARTIVVAGAGIGGLTAALALAGKGFRIVLAEKADRLEETGAGIQLAPNATRVLVGLGLRERLTAAAVVPEAIVIRTRRDREIARLPLGGRIEARFGAPYWIIHRGDLQAALLDAARAHHDIAIELGAEVDAFAEHANGMTVQAVRNHRAVDFHGVALVGADGLWSKVRARLAGAAEPQFAHRTAWRALVPAEAVATEFREPLVHLWLGRRSHLVHYPVKAGAMINIVAIATDDRPSAGWSTAAAPAEVMARFSRWSWSNKARDLLAVPTQWLKWPLYRRPALRRWGVGPVTLLGDAAHPMVPRGSNGAGQAILDARALASALLENGDPVSALARYEKQRLEATTRIVLTNRTNPPDAILREVFQRTNDRPFKAIDDVISREELATLSEGYKRIAGYSQEALRK